MNMNTDIASIDNTDARWPIDLHLLDEVPERLWWRGNPELLRELHRTVAVVGSRAATSYGELSAREIVEMLAHAGGVLMTGGAYGIDRAAMEAALIEGMPQIIVSPAGVDRLYPAGNAELIDAAIRADGLLLSPFAPATSPTRHRFLLRQRQMAALANGTVVVESGCRSGAVAHARCAAALGKPVAAVPGPITSHTSYGTNRLIQDGAARLLLTSKDIEPLLGTLGE